MADPEPIRDLARCAAFAEEAARLEAEARSLDDRGNGSKAVGPYQQAIQQLSEAAAACPEWHRDRPVIEEHLAQVQARVDYLQSLQGAPAGIPCARHVAPKQLTIRGEQGASGARTLGFAALLGAAAGLLAGGPRAALLLAAGAAHTTTRDDSVGHFARRLGLRGSDALMRAAKRASGRLQRLQIRDRQQIALCHLGQTVFAVRAALGAAIAWRTPSGHA